MMALRELHSLKQDTITIKIPAELKHYQQAEIIILPIEESINNNTEAFIQQFAGTITDFPDIEFEGIAEERDF